MSLSGGNKYRENVSPGLANAITLASMALPLAAMVHLALMSLGILQGLNMVGALEAALLLVIWLFIAVVIYRYSDRVLFGHPAHYLIHHIFLALYVITMSGFESPLVYLWAALIITSYISFAARGVAYSLTGLMMVMLISMANITDNHILAGMVFEFIMIVAASAMGILLITRNQIDKHELDKSFNKVFAQQDSLKTVVNSLTSAVIVINKTGHINLYNSAALSLLDTNQKLTKKPIDQVLKLLNSQKKPVSLDSILKKAEAIYHSRDFILPIDKEYLNLELTVSPIKSSYSPSKGNTQEGYIFIMRDITKEKTLEDEKDEFISVASHELRTPITVAEGTISNALVLMKKKALSKEKITEAVNLAHQQVLFLAKMVNDLSTLSRAERGAGDSLEEISIGSLLESIYKEYQKPASDKGLSLDLDVPHKDIAVRVSQLYLRELLQNFITNSLKYTTEGSITISAKLDKSGEKVTISVKDTGIGMSKSDQSKVFDKFFRSEDYRTRETGGTGLGLYVSKKLAGRLGTEIKLKSRLNHGSTFWIELPVFKSKKS